MRPFGVVCDSGIAGKRPRRQKDTPNRYLENPENGRIVPRVGAVRLPKPVADLAWSAPGWDFPPSARRSRPGGWNSSSVKVESRPTERTLRERSVMCHQVLTKSGAVAFQQNIFS